MINLEEEEELAPKRKSTGVSRQIVEDRLRFIYHTQLSALEKMKGPLDR